MLECSKKAAGSNKMMTPEIMSCISISEYRAFSSRDHNSVY